MPEGQQEQRILAMFIDFENEVYKEDIGRGVVVDVSVSGFAVDTETEMDVGKDYLCHIEIPLNVRARVMRRITEGQMKRYGLKFIGQSFFEKWLLRKAIKGKRQTKKV